MATRIGIPQDNVSVCPLAVPENRMSTYRVCLIRSRRRCPDEYEDPPKHNHYGEAMPSWCPIRARDVLVRLTIGPNDLEIRSDDDDETDGSQK